MDRRPRAQRPRFPKIQEPLAQDLGHPPARREQPVIPTGAGALATAEWRDLVFGVSPPTAPLKKA